MIDNILKKIGRFGIYKKNTFLVFSFYTLIILLLSFNAFSKFSKLQNSLLKLNDYEHVAINTLDKRKKIKNFIDEKTSSDKFFIDKNLENLTFLNDEKSLLMKLLTHPAFTNNESIKKRYDFVVKGKNKLKFAEENVNKTSLIKESDEVQLSSIEVDEKDLQKLLSIIEEESINIFESKEHSPQLIIKNFVLSKEKPYSFLLDMKLLKREYFKKKKS